MQCASRAPCLPKGGHSTHSLQSRNSKRRVLPTQHTKFNCVWCLQLPCSPLPGVHSVGARAQGGGSGDQPGAGQGNARCDRRICTTLVPYRVRQRRAGRGAVAAAVGGRAEDGLSCRNGTAGVLHAADLAHHGLRLRHPVGQGEQPRRVALGQVKQAVVLGVPRHVQQRLGRALVAGRLREGTRRSK